jgi:amidophosphoribosyltransferase
MPVVGELIAHNRTEEGVAEAIGADRLIYQSLPDLIDAVEKGNPRIRHFDTSCFSGEYVTGGVSDSYLERIAERRNDAAKGQGESIINGIPA